MEQLYSRAGLAALVALFWSGNALAFCIEPSMYQTPPSAPLSYSKPNAPFCLSGYKFSRTHSCNQFEIDKFIDQINTYIEDLVQYANEARHFANVAIEFANVAIEFANEAQDYAKCEAAEVKSAIK